MNLEPQDLAILQTSRDGDREGALARFADRHGPRLLAACRRLTGGVADGEDALQDVWVQIDRSLGGFRGESDLYTWAFRIALNVCLNRKRSLAAKARHVGLEADSLVAGPAAGGDPEFSCVSNFRSWIVERALLDLPEGQRLALTLHDLEEMTAPETAAALGIPVTAVKARVHRARHGLRERIAREFAARGIEVEAIEAIGCVSGLFEEPAAAYGSVAVSRQG